MERTGQAWHDDAIGTLDLGDQSMGRSSGGKGRGNESVPHADRLLKDEERECFCVNWSQTVIKEADVLVLLKASRANKMKGTEQKGID
jgi:hypothetical protein